MAKRFDYYAGYPNQQKTPKWVGVAIGSIFGALTLVMVGVGVRIAFPTRAAEASVATPKADVAIVAAQPMTAEAIAAEASTDPVAPQGTRHVSKHKKAARGAIRLASSNKPGASNKASKPSKRVQLFAKRVSGSRRDKRARDDLDKMLGL